MIKLYLQMFAEGGDGGAGAAAGAPAAAGAETATAAEIAENPEIKAGDTLPNGQTASAQVAAAMNRQMKRNPELRKVYGQGPKAEAQAEPAGAQAGTAEDGGKSIEERWNEIKKGEFAEQYGRDVQSAVQDRFKNAKDDHNTLEKLQPMLKVLQERAGVEDIDGLIRHVMDDDSLYEEAAAEADMPVSAYKQMKALESQLEEAKRREQESQEQIMIRQHLTRLNQQAEEFKKQFPDFDLMKTISSDRRFARLTSPEVGMSVEDAYFAIHHKELAPQMMAYGMQRAKQQMGQTLQAQRSRPVEGAAKAQGQAPAQVAVDPRHMTRQQREEVKRRAHLFGKTTL